MLRLAESNRTAQHMGLESFTVLQQRYTLLQPYVGADFRNAAHSPRNRSRIAAQQVLRSWPTPLLGGVYGEASPTLPVQYDNSHNRKILEIIREYAKKSGYSPMQLVLAGISGIPRHYPHRSSQQRIPSCGEPLIPPPKSSAG